jgi:predicted ribosomally synthesized peptide with SipW-like signal peptide
VRRTTAWALGGMLAGTALLGTGGTMATFSDTESLSATAGAGRLALTDPTTPGQKARQLTIGPAGASLPVAPDIEGDGTARLRLWAVEPVGGAPCDEAIVLSVTLPLPDEPVEADLCTLAREGVDLLAVGSGTPDFRLPVSVSVEGNVGPAARQWRGDLVLTLGQPGGEGFSDEQRLPVHVMAPNPQNGNANGKKND